MENKLKEVKHGINASRIKDWFNCAGICSSLKKDGNFHKFQTASFHLQES